MLILRGKSRCLAVLISVCTTPVVAGDPVNVYLRAPSEIEEQKNLEAVLEALPAQMAKWRAVSHRSVTYVVKQSLADMLVPDPCEALPIRVVIDRGRLLSATYEASAGNCKKGTPASRKSPRDQHRYLTPDELFHRVAKGKEELRCYKESADVGCLATTLRVTYDEKCGLPLKIEDYSETVSDYYWSLEVTELKVVP